MPVESGQKYKNPNDYDKQHQLFAPVQSFHFFPFFDSVTMDKLSSERKSGKCLNLNYPLHFLLSKTRAIIAHKTPQIVINRAMAKKMSEGKPLKVSPIHV